MDAKQLVTEMGVLIKQGKTDSEVIDELVISYGEQFRHLITITVGRFGLLYR